MKKCIALIFALIVALQAASLSAYAYTNEYQVLGAGCLEGLVADDILNRFAGSQYTAKCWMNPESDTDDAVADSAYFLGLWASEEIRGLPLDVWNRACAVNEEYAWCFGEDIVNNIENNFPYYYSYYFALKNYYSTNGTRSKYTYNSLYVQSAYLGDPEIRIRRFYEDLQPLITDFNNIIRAK